MMSRHQALRAAKGRSISRELQSRGIIVRAAAKGTMDEEMPEAYKDVNMVVDVVHRANLAAKVARMRPIGVVKG
jgi:tRNA-splicing ligase RtcB